MDILRDEMRNAYPSLNDAFLQYLMSQGFNTTIISHLTRCFAANVATGKLHRGLATLYIGKQLAVLRLTDQQSKQLCILAWLVEILGAHYLILDDIMDESTTRRGAPCWYRQPHVGMMAINDACILKSAIFFLLKKFLSHHPSYMRMIDLFMQGGLHTELGQLCDVAASKEPNIENFSMRQYWSIVRHKSSYSISVPVILALEYWQRASPKNLAQTYGFSLALGEYFQVNDDYVDIYGDYAVTGKHGTDIQDNKCTWFIVEALYRANPENRKKLSDAYGKKDQAHVDMVKKIFSELGMQTAFREYEERQRLKIENFIAAVDETEGLPREVFRTLFNGFRQGRQF